MRRNPEIDPNLQGWLHTTKPQFHVIMYIVHPGYEFSLYEINSEWKAHLPLVLARIFIFDRLGISVKGETENDTNQK